MKTKLIALTLLTLAMQTFAGTHYVDVNSPNPTPPYTSWATAATNIQDAVDAAVDGDEVVVTNGIYATGGRAVGTNLLVNRVVVDKPITLLSVNGPLLTIIQGYQVPTNILGVSAIRCVYLTAGATLSGFTLTNGATLPVEDDPDFAEGGGGGVWCASITAVVSNCVLAGNSASDGGGAVGGTLNNCVLSGNGAWTGGGAFNGTLSGCTLTSNSAGLGGGGGAAASTLFDCVLNGNSAPDSSGGGASLGSTLTHCVLIGNSAHIAGGGASDSILQDCNLSGNSAAYGFGGGVASCSLANCILSNNVAGGDWASGGGAYQSTLINCTLSGNSTDFEGGGAAGSTLIACILTNNSAGFGGGADGSTLKNCTLAGNVANYGGGASSSTLSNCVVTGNLSDYAEGGGVIYCSLNNCMLIRNTATTIPFFSGGAGGGAAESTLTNCLLISNSASDSGGGAFYGTLNNCALIGNSADWGGGVAYATLNNCILTSNSANAAGGGAYDSAPNNCVIYFNNSEVGSNYLFFTGSSTPINYCCTTPIPTNGVGNITNAPLFLNAAGGDFRLQSNSPCINAGNNAYVPDGSDLDGNPRIAGGTVDIGAYEFQNPASIISYAWLQQYGWPTDGSADFTDPDGDGMNNWQEWRTGTGPTNAASVLKMLMPVATNNPPGLTVSWQSVAGINYFLQRSTNLPFFTTIATNIPGQAGTTTSTDTNAIGSGPFLYRIGVGN